jgi:hypothetical protein
MSGAPPRLDAQCIAELSDVYRHFDHPIFATRMNAIARSTLVQRIHVQGVGLDTAGYAAGYHGSRLGNSYAALTCLVHVKVHARAESRNRTTEIERQIYLQNPEAPCLTGSHYD